MAEYEQTQNVNAPPQEVFAWLSDVGSLPAYLPPVVEAWVEGPAEGGNPGQKLRTTLEYPGGENSRETGTFVAEGYLAVDEDRRRMEWGAEVERDYSGWLTVSGGAGDGDSLVTVHLSFGERSAEPRIEERSSGDRDPIPEGISSTLESIRRQIEEGSGKEQPSPPPPGAEPNITENPAVVDEDPPS